MLARIYFSVIIFSIFICACNKTDPFSPGSYRLKRFEIGFDSGGIYYNQTYFDYNSQNLITKMVDSTSQGYGLRTLIEYNSQNKPIKFTWFPLNNSYAQFDSVIYNSKQQFIKRLKGNFYADAYFMTNQYEYDQKERLIADSTYSYEYINNDNVLMLKGYTTFNYDNNDNISYTRQFGKVGGIMQEIYRTDYTYDKNTNPFRSIGWTAYFNRTSGYSNIFGENHFPSKNNVVSIKYSAYPGYIKTFSYKYENNRVKNIVVRVKSATNEYSSPVNFYYE